MKKEPTRSVAVVGLGYVGLPIAVAFGKLAPVIGFDIDKTKVEELREGIDRTDQELEKDLSAAAHRRRSTIHPSVGCNPQG
jgi:UDP-N-acetyl-D-galactosamine dehydrogenase